VSSSTDLKEIRPFCVDLDGSLIKTDSLHELVLKLLKLNVFLFIRLPFWLAKGKAHLKSEINRRVQLDPACLPYDEDILSLISEQKSRGAKVYLVSGCDIKTAEAVSNHLKLFDGVFASDGTQNLTGSNKARLLVNRFGEKGFDYLGNDDVDELVWRHCSKVYVVGTQSFADKVTLKFSNLQSIIRKQPSISSYIKAIRVHQWVKNGLIFIPLILDVQNASIGNVIASVLGFLAFSLLASSTYIINDLLDLESDRTHTKKRFRAFASGEVSIKSGIAICILLFSASILLLCFLPLLFSIVSLVYLFTTLLYSFHIKTMVILDACVLAGLFTVRVIGGITLIDSDWSFWLLAFSMFFFLSLALTKRASELYINSEKVVSNYLTPGALWLICPLLLYWIGRMWLKTSRGEMNEDPIVFALKDRISHLVALLCGCTVLLATTDMGLL